MSDPHVISKPLTRSCINKGKTKHFTKKTKIEKLEVSTKSLGLRKESCLKVKSNLHYILCIRASDSWWKSYYILPRNKSLVRTREVFFLHSYRQKLQHIVRQTSLWMVNLLLASKLMLGWHIKIVVNGTIRRIMGTSPHSSHTLLGGRNWIMNIHRC